jgi:hypothetical protein
MSTDDQGVKLSKRQARALARIQVACDLMAGDRPFDRDGGADDCIAPLYSDEAFELFSNEWYRIGNKLLGKDEYIIDHTKMLEYVLKNYK